MHSEEARRGERGLSKAEKRCHFSGDSEEIGLSSPYAFPIDRKESHMANVLILQHLPYEGPGTIEEYLRVRHIPFVSRNTYLGGDKLYPHHGEFSHLVVMGGFMAVYERDRYPFLIKEMTFMERFAAQGGRILGVCLGAQMLAHILGARVYKGTSKEIGWYEIIPTPAGRKDPIFSSLLADNQPLWAFQWHGDTFDMPKGATLLASTTLYPHQAFSWDSRLYGLQFHIEVDQTIVEEWFPEKPDLLTPPSPWDTLHRKAFRFYEVFFGNTEREATGKA